MLTITSLNVQGRTPKAATPLVQSVIDHIKTDGSLVIAIQGCNKNNQEAICRAMKASGLSAYRFEELSLRQEYELLFTNTPIAKKDYTIFRRTARGRGVSRYLLKFIGYEMIEVVTSYLDEEPATRRVQIAEMIEMSKQVPRTIFAGDTNIPVWQSQAIGIPTGYSDAWREHGVNANEKTNDDGDRLDRVWYRGVECTGFDVIDVGTSRKGVIATFKLIPEKVTERIPTQTIVLDETILDD